MLKWVMCSAVLCLTKQLQQHQICFTVQSEWGHAEKQSSTGSQAVTHYVAIYLDSNPHLVREKASAERSFQPGPLRHYLRAISLKAVTAGLLTQHAKQKTTYKINKSVSKYINYWTHSVKVSWCTHTKNLPVETRRLHWRFHATGNEISIINNNP